MEGRTVDLIVSGSLEEVLLTNLKLLGYKPSDSDSDLRIPLQRDMFKKANQRAMEVLVYFFLQILATPEQLNRFMFCWPPRTPDMRREFKEEAYSLLQRLQEEGKLPANTLLGKSVLDIAQGERIVQLLKVLSESTMRWRLKQEMPWQTLPYFPTADEYLASPALVSRSSLQRIKKALVVHIQQQIQEFNTRAKHMVLSQKAWVQHAQDLVQMHKRLREELDELKKEASDHGADLMDRIAAVDRIPQIDMTRYIWRNLAALDEESLDLKGEYAIEKILKLESDRRQLDSVGTPPSFSDLLDESTPDTERSAGRNRLDRVVSQWTHELKSVAELFEKKHQEQLHFTKQPRLLNVTEHLTGLIGRAEQEHRDQVERLRDMNTKLQDEIGRVKLSLATYQYREKQDPARD